MVRTVEVKYTEYWVARVIKDTLSKKTCIKEIEFLTPPTEQDIVDILITLAPNEFISLEHNYRMGDLR